MARKNQKLINYHTGKKTEMPSGSSVDFGEIVVRHNEEAPELLIKVGTDSFAVFQASGAVQTAINTAVSAAQSTLNTTISGLQSDVKSLSSATKTLIDEVSAATKDTYATKADLEATSGSIITAYTTAIGNVAGDLNELSGVVSSITENYVTNSTLNTTVETLEGKISTAKKEATDASSAYTDTQIAAAKEYSDGKLSAATETLKGSIKTLSGNVETAIGNLETELTNKITNVYRYKGSRTYAELPTTGNVTGDVWNVTDAHDKFPAGTNYAWDGEKWDALGGSVDLSPYAKTEDVNESIKTVKQSITNLDSKVGEFSSATVTEFASLKKYAGDTYATKDELKSTSGSIITAYTEAISAAKKEAIGTASGYTDAQVLAAKDSVYLSATTAAAADAKTKADTAYSSAVTAAAASAETLNNSIEAVKTTADKAVQTASIVDSDSKVSVSKVDTELKFDFSNLVVDCGDF